MLGKVSWILEIGIWIIGNNDNVEIIVFCFCEVKSNNDMKLNLISILFFYYKYI